MLGNWAGDLDHEEIQRRENHQSSTGGGRRHPGPGCLQETPDHRTDFLSLVEQIRSMTVLEVRRLKELEHDNAQRKQIVADLTLDNRILRDVNQKSGEAVGAPSNGGLSQIQLSGQ